MYPHLSVVSPGYVLTSEDVKLGTVDEKEHVMFLLLGPGSLTQFTSRLHGFFFTAGVNSSVHVHYIFIIHSSCEGHLACFCLPAVVNKVAVSTEEPDSEEGLVHLLGLLIW